jgi:hypothetical protein
MNWQVYIFGGLLLATVYICYCYNMLVKENEQMRVDVKGLSLAMSNAVEVTKSESGRIMAETKTVKLSQDMAKQYLSADLNKLREEFRVKIKDLKTYTQIGTSYTAPVQSQGRDTVIMQTIEKVYHLNGNLSGSVYTKGDSLFGKVVVNDTIRITVSKGKRDKWWKLWEKRPLVTNAFMSNRDGVVTELKSVVVSED